MKIYVIGSSKNKFLPLDDIREKFLIDEKHEGANIDFLNPWYCELTGLYYLLKHVDDDIVGLEHYRTYFYKNNKLIDKNEITDILKTNDIILGGFQFPIWKHKTLREDLEKNITIGKEKLNIFLNVLKNKDINFYNFFIAYINGDKLYSGNMFIGKKTILNNWFDFLLDVLVDYEKICKISPLDSKTFRREGYLSEFMFGAWILYNKYKIKEFPIKKFTRNLNGTEFLFNGTAYKVGI